MGVDTSTIGTFVNVGTSIRGSSMQTSLIPREGEPRSARDADMPLTTLWDAW